MNNLLTERDKAFCIRDIVSVYADVPDGFSQTEAAILNMERFLTDGNVIDFNRINELAQESDSVDDFANQLDLRKSTALVIYNRYHDEPVDNSSSYYMKYLLHRGLEPSAVAQVLEISINDCQEYMATHSLHTESKFKVVHLNKCIPSYYKQVCADHKSGLDIQHIAVREMLPESLVSSIVYIYDKHKAYMEKAINEGVKAGAEVIINLAASENH